MRILIICLLICLASAANAQKWVDTAYSIQIDRDSLYGRAVDFAGNNRKLHVDIAYPINDTAPECGRPLMVVLYGGAWMSGNKEVPEVQNLMKDFAKRGYVAVAPNYRLGVFQTAQNRNCNISSIGLEWNCLNVQDTAEWYRAYYRAIQDVKGAIRFMVKHKEDFDIDPQNVFTAGFSAGGFTALGVGFLDHLSEWKALAVALPSVQQPNNRYNVGCVQKYQWDTSISSMDLTRPDLGSLEGSLHPNQTYTMRGVGNFYGAMFYNLLDSGTSTPPAIYGFHQPNDLIVPYNYGHTVFQGFSACAYSLCRMGIVNRPVAYSSPTIRDWAQNAPNPVDMYFDSTRNFTNCAGQIADPSKGGHQLDNWDRTWNMARFFATKLDTSACNTASINPSLNKDIVVFPNPSNGQFTIRARSCATIRVLSLYGTLIHTMHVATDEAMHAVNFKDVKTGVYIIELELEHGYSVYKRVVVK